MFKKINFILIIFFVFQVLPQKSFSSYDSLKFRYFKKIAISPDRNIENTDKNKIDEKISVSSKEISNEEGSNSLPINPFMVIPFVLLLLMIATGPLFYEHFWHNNYKKIAISFAIIVISYYFFILKDKLVVLEIIFDYIQFISLISTLYIVSGGIYIQINSKATPLLNSLILFFGAIISNFIGTTGASMLLIRPYMRINKNQLSIYHIVFFIFIISNVGGALTPIGDPPLFLGFLKGVPFFWTMKNNIIAWLIVVTILILIYTILNIIFFKSEKENTYKSFNISISGYRNIMILFVVISLVFLDPNIFSWVPSLNYHGHHFSFIREILLFLIAYFSYINTSKDIKTKNKFSFEPLNEVVFIFIGIFGTMSPAMEIVSYYAKSDLGTTLTQAKYLYWSSGLLSSFLDNAPTYLNFLAASMGADHASITNIHQVKSYSEGIVYPGSILKLKAISLGSVFFGAMTYIGNGPNFMVKAIAEEEGVKMPSFFGYLFRYSIIFLLPVLFIVWLLFF